MKTVILTFDDGLASHAEFVAPMLKEQGFGATFFVCTNWIGAERRAGHKLWRHMTRGQIQDLHNDGFEIGNHLHTHCNMRTLNRATICAEIRHAESILDDNGIARPVSFCPPGFHYDEETLAEIRTAGYRYVRAGCGQHVCFESFQAGGSGPPFSLADGRLDEIACSVAGKNYGLDMLIADVERLGPSEVTVLCFHDFEVTAQVDIDWTYSQFEACVAYMRDNRFRVLGLRDLEVLTGELP